MKNFSTTLAHSTIRQLIEFGVTDFVLSPGSRNAPLSIALDEAASAGLIELHVRIDERGAGFFALGMAKVTKRYVACICTSGTAVANYHPSALEAFHSDTSVLYLTADRPARLRNTGANQTTLQDGILFPLETFDTPELFDISKVLLGGPIHINLQFDEPLLPAEESNGWLAGLSRSASPQSLPATQSERLTVKSDGLLVVGHDRGNFSVAEIMEFADILDWPIVAEDPLSFPDAISHASLFLTDEGIRQGLASDEVIVIGRTTLSRSINAYIAQTPEVIVIDPRTETVDIDREGDQVFAEIPHVTKHATSDEWCQLWQSAGRISAEVIGKELEWSEQMAVRAIAHYLPDGSALFIGSSRPIRDLEGFATPRSGVETFANRGLAGIDGNIATSFGIATKFARSYAILGDLTFLHDLSALVNLPDINHTIFLIDNNGGGIFSTLPQAGVAGFERIFGTPHNQNIEKIISGFGISVARVKTVSDIEREIAMKPLGLHIVVIEVPRRAENAQELKRIAQSVASAVRIGSNLA